MQLKEIQSYELKQMLDYSIEELIKHLKDINKRVKYSSFECQSEQDVKKQKEIIDILDFVHQKIK